MGPDHRHDVQGDELNRKLRKVQGVGLFVFG
jgi:hypothetical protein